LIEELKLTKNAAGDSGSQIGELSKNLRLAKENAAKYEKEAKDLAHTLETRTANSLKEKTDLKQQLDKALKDLKSKSSNSSEMITENAELRSELEAAKKMLSSSEMELEILKD